MTFPVGPAFNRFEGAVIVGIRVNSGETYEDDAALGRQADSIGQFAEVFVMRKNDTFFRLRACEDFFVLFAAH
jgi:hypothetical protein